MQKTLDIFVILNQDFTNFFLKESFTNIQEVIDYTHENSDIKVKNIHYVLNKKDEHKYFHLDSSPFEHSLVYTNHEKIIDIFNYIKTLSDADYVAFYSNNCFWVKNHLVESIKSINLYKTNWSVSKSIEIKTSIANKTKSVISYTFKNPSNHLINDVLIGEVVIKNDTLKSIDFNRGRIVDGNKELFYIGYALNAQSGKYSETPMCTVRYFMDFKEGYNLNYINFDNYKFDLNEMLDEDKDKIVFSVLVNLYNIRNQYKFSALETLKNQKFPLTNVEFLFISNFNSLNIYFPEDKLKEMFPHYKVIYVPNQQENNDLTLDHIAYANAIKYAEGKIITYFDISEEFLYTPATLSEIYRGYKEDKNINWTLSNYYDVINYMHRHSNMLIPNREQLYYTLFSHKKEIETQYAPIKSIDKNFKNNNLTLLNLLNSFQQKQLQGKIISNAIIQKG